LVYTLGARDNPAKLTPVQREGLRFKKYKGTPAPAKTELVQLEKNQAKNISEKNFE